MLDSPYFLSRIINRHTARFRVVDFGSAGKSAGSSARLTKALGLLQFLPGINEFRLSGNVAKKIIGDAFYLINSGNGPAAVDDASLTRNALVRAMVRCDTLELADFDSAHWLGVLLGAVPHIRHLRLSGMSAATLTDFSFVGLDYVRHLHLSSGKRGTGVELANGWAAVAPFTLTSLHLEGWIPTTGGITFLRNVAPALRYLKIRLHDAHDPGSLAAFPTHFPQRVGLALSNLSPASVTLLALPIVTPAPTPIPKPPTLRSLELTFTSTFDSLSCPVRGALLASLRAMDGLRRVRIHHGEDTPLWLIERSLSKIFDREGPSVLAGDCRRDYFVERWDELDECDECDDVRADVAKGDESAAQYHRALSDTLQWTSGRVDQLAADGDVEELNDLLTALEPVRGRQLLWQD